MQIDNPLEKFDLKNVIAAFSRRQDGNMSLVFGQTRDSLENRKKFLSGLGIDYRNLVTAKQVHGKNVEYVTQKNMGSGALDYATCVADTDGFITDQRLVPIAILTADCLSVFIYDPKHPAIAVLHAGWRSTEQNISREGIERMQNRFGSQPQDLLVGFGPSIRACCFEVEKDFKSNFPFGLLKRDGRVFMDIALINRQHWFPCGTKKNLHPRMCKTQGQKYFLLLLRSQSAAAG